MKMLLIFLLTTATLNNCSRTVAPESANDNDEIINSSLEIKNYDSFDSTTDCDYLILTDIAFLNSALKLAQYRRNFEYDKVIKPRVLLTQTIDSNYFSKHSGLQITTIKSTINSIKTNWKFKPKFIVLFTDDQIKPRLYSGIPTPDSSLFSDLYYTDIDSNGSSDVILGRIPVSTEDEAENYVKKIMNFESGNVNNMLIITDDKWQGIYPDGIKFEFIRQEVDSYFSQLVKPSIQIEHFNLNDFSIADSLPLNVSQRITANKALIDSLNSGNKIVTYLGHASHQFLTDEHILTVYDIEKLQSLDLWVSMGCNSNQYTFEDSFAKRLLRMPETGAVAFIAPYPLGYANIGKEMILTFYSFLCDNETKYSAGEAFYLSVNKLNMLSRAGYFVYLGDPALIVRF